MKNNNKSSKTTKKQDINKDNILLSIQNASYRYSDAEENEYALRDVNYNFEKGKIYAIRGRSGTGKTTLLSLISGLERCTEGSIIFDGKDLKNINLDTYRNSQIGIVFQSYNLLPYMTASENIILSMDASGAKIKNKKQKAIELMQSVGLKESYADRKVLRLSGGEQQRVAIARSLSYNPKMIVADEPTGNLDKQTESEILDIFKKLAHEEGKCVIIVTHSQNVCDIVDEIYDLKKTK
ncbi:MAG: ABC transporter ATP-binding protein [Bacilli bacterium]|nr:ABC transporter ATP-binding protein [Bacilli bacterium]